MTNDPFDALAAQMDDHPPAERRDLFDELSEALDEPEGTSWIPVPKPGYEASPSRIMGTVTSIGTFPLKAKKPGDPTEAPIVSVRDRSNPDLVWLVRGYHKMLRDELATAAPNPGDAIGIEFRGKRDGVNGEYFVYRVRVER